MNEKEEINEENSTKKILLSIILITILVISVISLSFATFQKEQNDRGSNSITTQNISMNYTENVNGISINNALPMSDNVGKKLTGKGEYFDFTINTTIVGKSTIMYEIAAIKDSSSTIPDSNIKLYLEQQISGSYESVMEPKLFTPITTKSEIGSPKGSMILKTVTKDKTSSDNYRLRMWINESSSVGQEQSYTVKINVYGKAQ